MPIILHTAKVSDV